VRDEERQKEGVEEGRGHAMLGDKNSQLAG